MTRHRFATTCGLHVGFRLIGKMKAEVRHRLSKMLRKQEVVRSGLRNFKAHALEACHFGPVRPGATARLTRDCQKHVIIQHQESALQMCGCDIKSTNCTRDHHTWSSSIRLSTSLSRIQFPNDDNGMTPAKASQHYGADATHPVFFKAKQGLEYTGSGIYWDKCGKSTRTLWRLLYRPNEAPKGPAQQEICKSKLKMASSAEALKTKLGHASVAPIVSAEGHKVEHMQLNDQVEPELVATTANLSKFVDINPTLATFGEKLP
uniref:Uncharacterized protein n=1 Tax=Physcomitrium patens TaxID=3218 RepID=A9SN66_PHYPA|nr:hypothetical protein PHYPA_010832 [Physcomitrium patens]